LFGVGIRMPFTFPSFLECPSASGFMLHRIGGCYRRMAQRVLDWGPLK